MPELPEVETVVRTLRPALVGATLGRAWASGLPLRMGRRPDLTTLRALCEGARIRDLRRRGKYILIDFAPAGGLLVHLGMTGRLRLHDADEPRAKHTHAVWQLPKSRELRFIDPRRFGWVAAVPDFEALAELRALGPDPLAELDAAGLGRMLAASRAPIKSFLLDQRRIAGLGNIYACEALFRARIHPRRPARRARGESERLLAAIRETLEIGIANRGTSLRDFVDAAGTPGRNVEALVVYGREGEACTVCGAAIRRTVDAGRSTFFCRRCQRH